MKLSTYRRYGHTLRRLVLLCSTVLIASCTREFQPSGGGTTPPVTGEPLPVTMRLTVSELEEVAPTRADNGIGEIHVITFDNAGLMTDAPQSAQLSPDGTRYVVMLNPALDSREVWILANATAALEAYRDNAAAGFPAGTWKVLNQNGVSATNATTKNHLINNLKTTALPSRTIGSSTYITAQPADNPTMFNYVTLPDGINATTIISDAYESDGITPKPIQLIRTTAKVTVETVGTLPDFEILGASMGNVAQDGYIYPTLRTNTPYLPYAHNGSPDEGANYRTMVGAEDASHSLPLYCYETAGGGSRLYVILHARYKGAAGYYRIDLVEGDMDDDPADRAPLDIVRNGWYKIQIGRLDAGGYPTLAEATANRASNLQYTISAELQWPVRDLEAHDIVSNGDYYLGVSNSTFIAYSNGAAASGTMTAATMTHNAPASVTTGTVEVSGTGLTLMPSSGLTILPGASSATFVPNTTRTARIEIALSASFPYTAEGKITIRLGNLTKVIEVIRRAPLPAAPGVLADFATGVHTLGKTSGEVAVPDWITFSVSATDAGSPGELNNEEGNIYIHYNRNVAPSGTSPRGTELFLARDDEGGRTKVVLNQNNLNIDEVVDSTPPAGFTPYVGAFWKNSQTGERLIRVRRPTSDAADGEWTAMVIEGTEWIVLDRQPSRDGNIWGKNGAAAPDTYQRNGSFDTAHAVNGGSDIVSGTLRPAGVAGYQSGDEDLYFRIGLTGPNPASAPRYGVVLLTYKGNTKSQRIYIRQGEAADYLMRPEDPNAGGTGWSAAPDTRNRPVARKILPYNLSDPQYREASNSFSWDRTLPRESLLTLYPSQIGYHFAFNRYAFSPPVQGASLSTFDAYITDYWANQSAETCPDGYHRPNDGSTSGPVAGSAGTVAGSEMRQSLWLNPKEGSNRAGTSNSDNSLGGFYADGFFDRGEFDAGAGTNVVAYNPGVALPAGSNVERRLAAAAGNLYFNPRNNASIFLPAGGLNQGASDQFTLGAVGQNGLYWSSTVSGTGSSTSYPGSAPALFFNPADPYVNFMDASTGGMHMLPVRCVEDALQYDLTVGYDANYGTVTLAGATIADSAPRVIEAGSTVSLTAEAAYGHTFDGWTAAGVTLADPSQATIGFLMPAGPVQLSATFTALPGGGGKGGNQQLVGYLAPAYTLAVDANGVLNLDGQNEVLLADGTTGVRPDNYAVVFHYGSLLALGMGSDAGLVNTDFDSSQHIAWVPQGYTVPSSLLYKNIPSGIIGADSPTTGRGDPCHFAVKDGVVGGHKIPATQLPGTNPTVQSHPVFGQVNYSTDNSFLLIYGPFLAWSLQGKINNTVNNRAYYWSSYASTGHLYNANNVAHGGSNQEQGFPIRCVAMN